MRVGKHVCPEEYANSFTPMEFEEVGGHALGMVRPGGAITRSRKNWHRPSAVLSVGAYNVVIQTLFACRGWRSKLISVVGEIHLCIRHDYPM